MITEQGKAKTIFLQAVEIASPDQRQAFVAAACENDEALRREVEDLLRHQGELGSFLESPAAELRAPIQPGSPEPQRVEGMVTIDEAIAERPGMVIGPYKLLQQIGEGGMGTVFMAEQTQPVQRKVALKILKPGMDSRQVLGRFEAERQALALMDHPNIAKVIDAGTTNPVAGGQWPVASEEKPDAASLATSHWPLATAGRPYFVMELVKGVPITKYCDDHHLTPKQRLELFVPVCQAVQHAHQKGIIHRDLKPSNVLVAEYDDKPVAKVIDFGVAKATGPKLTERTLFTEFGQIVGTLEYMSPEQAKLNALDIDTRSDIYALGVLLYELLTGTTPFEKKRLHQAALDEVLRIIREEEPPKPSTRLSTTKELPSIAANRGLEPKKLSGLVRGELDWIVMKCLEKDRNRRYETASSFAMDIQRYLGDEPVLACPPSGWYRFRKFARRNKARLAVGGLIFFFLVLIGGGSSWVIRDRAARNAVTEENVRLALDEAERLQEERRWLGALEAVKRAEGLVAASDSSLQLQQQVRGHRQDLEMIGRLEDIQLQSTAVKEGHFDRGSRDQAYAQAFRDYGIDVLTLDPAKAGERLREKSVHVQLAAALDDWAIIRKGPGTSSEELRAIARAADPDSWRNRLRDAMEANSPEILKNLAAAAPVHELPPSTLMLLGEALGNRGAVAQAVTLLRQAQLLYPGDFWINHTLAHWLSEGVSPQLDEALRFYTAAAVLRPQSMGARQNVGAVLWQKERWDEAFAEYREALRISKDIPEAQAHLQEVLGYSYKDMGWTERAEALLKDAESTYASLVHDYPETTQYSLGLADVYSDLGLLYDDNMRQADKAEVFFLRALRIREKLAQEHPDVLHYVFLAGLSYRRLGTAALIGGRLDVALTRYDRAIESLQRAANKGHPEAREHLVMARILRAGALAQRGEYPKAIEEAEAVVRQGDLNRDQLYNVCCLFSLASDAAASDSKLSPPDRAKLKAQYSDRAMEFLRRALANGFRNVAGLKADKDLDPLRSRADFQKLVQELELKTKQQ
jgi:serine/threonine protein kinase/tetratricopeptide (TPR) repeat protein